MVTFVAPGADTILAQGNATATNATALSAAANAFIARLISDSGINFSSIGGHDVLSYLQWDYNADLNQLYTLRPGNVILDLATPAADIDRMRAVPTPSEPALDIPVAVIPSLDAERPVIVLPALPGTDVGTAPTDVPSLLEVAAPDAPIVLLPNVPTFEELQIPAAPSFSLPSLTSQLPVNLLSPPTGNFSYVDAQYTSDLRDPLVAKLLYDLENGGYGIDANDELALWTRARDRAEQAAKIAVDDASRRAALSSFPMPQGAFFADVDRARQAYLAKLSEANMDIALKRADLYVANRRFTLEQVQQYEKIDRDLFNAIQERALNAAKATVELGLAVYDASVRNYNSQLDAYKAEASVFEVRIRAELAKAELFKSQVEAETLRGQINQQRIQLYQSQLNGIQTTVNLYKTRVEATSLLQQIQQQKLEIFKTRVEAFAVTVKAKAAEYDMYRSAVQGELAKLDIYKTDIAAYEAKLRGEDIRTKVLMSGNEALTIRFNSAVQKYNAEINGLAKVVDGSQDQNRQLLASLAVNVQSYRALTDAVLAGVQVKKDTQAMNNAWNIAAINSRVSDTKLRLEEYIATVSNRNKIDEFGAKHYGDQVAAALSSLNSLTAKSV